MSIKEAIEPQAAMGVTEKPQTRSISGMILQLFFGKMKGHDGASHPPGGGSGDPTLELSETNPLRSSPETDLAPLPPDVLSAHSQVCPANNANVSAHPVIAGGTRSNSQEALSQPTGSSSGIHARRELREPEKKSSKPSLKELNFLPAGHVNADFHHRLAAKTVLDPKAFHRREKIPYLKGRTVWFPEADQFISNEHKERFPVVKDCFKDNVSEHRGLSREKLATIVCQLAMCGVDMDDASPSVLIFCHPKAIRRVRRCLTRDHVRQQYEGGSGPTKYPAFRVFFWAKDIDLLGDSVDLVDIPYNQGSSLCASPILSVNQGRLCTVSCVLIKDGKPYAMTSAHNLHVDQPTPDDDAEHEINDGSGSETEDEEEDTEYEFPDHLGDQGPGMCQTRNPAGTTLFEPGGHHTEYTHMARSCPITRPPPFLPRERFAREILRRLPWSKGRLSRQNLDWALVELDKAEDWFPNRFRSPSADGLEVDDWYISPDPVPAGSAPATERIVVIALSTGPVMGKIRPHAAFVGNWDDSRAWLQVWTVLLTNPLDKLKRGDSGALVIDYESRRPYGHLIAANPLGDGYLVPLATTIQQMKYIYNSTDIKLLSAGHELQESERVRWFHLAVNRVRDSMNVPERSSSVGTKRGQLMDKDGNPKYVCFDAVGPARMIWKSLGPEISRLLSTEDSEIPQLVVNFYLIGTDAGNVTPVVLFASEDAATRKNARFRVQESGIMNEARYRGIRLGDAPTTPRLLSLGNMEYPESLSPPGTPILSMPTDNALGRRLYVPNVDGISVRPATAGPVLYINGEVFQLTVGHAHTFPFTREQLGLSPEGDTLWNIDGFEECHSSPDSGTSTENLKSQPNLSLSAARGVKDPPFLQADSSSSPSDIAAPSTHDFVPPAVKRIGKISLVSSPESGKELDYALIQLETRVHRANRIPLGSSWLRVTNVWDGDVKDGRVVVMTGSSGLLSGTVSATPSYIRFPWRRNIQQVYPVTLNGALQQGDCGAAVVNRMNGDFLGHLVVGIEGSGLGYMVRACEVVSDISSRMKAVVGLGSPNHTQALLGWAEFGSNHHVRRLPAFTQQPQTQFRDNTASTNQQQQHSEAGKQISNKGYKFESTTLVRTINPEGSQKRALTDGSFQGYLFDLPVELVTRILGWLPIVDLVSLRLVSRSWNTLIVRNEGLISQHYLQQGHVPPLITLLFPPPPSLQDLDLNYIAGLWYRFRVASKLSTAMADWILTEFFLAPAGGEQRATLHAQERLLRRRMTILLFAVFHFLESYQRGLVTLSQSGAMAADMNTMVQRQIIGCYEDDILLQMHQLFPLLVAYVTRKLRPPTYLGTIERYVKGYTRSPPPERVQVAIFCVGGLPEILRLTGAEMPYEARISAVDEWYAGLTQSSAQPTSASGWNTIISTPKLATKFRNWTTLGTKAEKECRQQEVGESGEAKGKEVLPVVLKSSLSSGPPAQRPAPNDIERILRYLPTMKSQIWGAIAEDTLITRGVVRRTQDILKDANVLQALTSLERTKYERLFDGTDYEEAY